MANRRAKGRDKRPSFDPSLKPGVGKRAIVPEGGLDDTTGKVWWTFGLFDNYTGWVSSAGPDCFCAVSDKMKQFELRTWREIAQDGARNHAVEVDKLCSDARKRLQEIQLDEVSALWSFRFSGTNRIWGVRTGRLFQVVWWDPEHRVCPVDLQSRERNRAR